STLTLSTAAPSSLRSSAVPSTLPLLLSFGIPLERVEPGAPELLQERPELGEPLGTRSIQPSRAVASLAHEPRLLEHRQVLGDRRSGDVEVRGDLPRRELLV